jgi:PIN domain nuclease of toxin-antitoxin system
MISSRPVTMSILPDSQVFVWARIAPERSRKGERQALDRARFRYVGSVTLWEIAVLMTLGRAGEDELLFDAPVGLELLPIRPQHCKALVASPKLHRDPFDRMPIAQARVEGTPLLTRDAALIAYGTAGAGIAPADG